MRLNEDKNRSKFNWEIFRRGGQYIAEYVIKILLSATEFHNKSINIKYMF